MKTLWRIWAKSQRGKGRKKQLTKFEKTTNIVEKLPADHVMVEATWAPLTEDSVAFNKHSVDELDEVLDQLQISPTWLARLEQIIEDSK